jgi:catechol 2,3-dioxygenase-like lactoylglutathione lyase family enzyme
MNWTLEVVIVPVSDVDRAKAFYAEQLGFNVDHDSRDADGNGPVQLTPPGSGCSIVIGKGMVEMAPGSLKGIQLVVPDLPAARAQLVERGVQVSGIQLASPAGFRPASGGEDLDNVGFVFFDDPDGNAWAVQQISSRAGG